MAFCEKCGKSIADGEVCSCQAEPKGNKNKKGLLVPVAAVVIIAIIAIVIAASKPYMKPVNDFMKLVNNKTVDVTKLTAALSPDFCVKASEKVYKTLKDSDTYNDGLDDSNDSLESNYERLDDEFDEWKITFDMKSKEKLDKDDLEDIQDACNDYYEDYFESSIESNEELIEDEDFEDTADALEISEKQAEKYLKALVAHYEAHEDVKITKGYEIKGKFIIETDDDEYKTETVTFRVVKINGDWAYAGVVKGSTYFEDSSEFNFISYYLTSGYTTR